MIEASFEKNQSRSAAVSGAYQYDTGQRLAMHGLPSPSEMAGRDDLLSGDLVTVQAQFSYVGDSQADMRLAQWHEGRKVWLVDVPDEYLTRHRDVHVYVFVYYGSDDNGERAETQYEATFRPISRPAPSGTVTEGQLEQWATLKGEIEISLNKVDAAVSGAGSAAETANAAESAADHAAEEAKQAAKTAQDAMDSLADLRAMPIRAVALSAGSAATAAVENDTLVLGVPDGADGKKGPQGDTGPADVSFAFDASTATLTITTKE